MKPGTRGRREAPGSLGPRDVSKHKQGCWDGFSRRLGASSLTAAHAQPRKAIAPSTQGKRDTRSKRLYPVGNRQHHNSASEAATKRRNSKNRSLSHSLIQTRQTTMSLETWIGLARNGLCVVADTLPDEYDQFGYFENGMSTLNALIAPLQFAAAVFNARAALKRLQLYKHARTRWR